MPMPAELSGPNSPTRNETAGHSFDQDSITNPLLRSLNFIENQNHHHQSNRSSAPPPPPRPPNLSVGEYAKSIVYGGMDAIVTCFSLISSISSAGSGRLSSADVLVLGFANLVADGISMGFGDYVSSKTEKNMSDKERDIITWEVERDHQALVADGSATQRRRRSTVGGGSSTKMEQELMRRFTKLGMDSEDASTVVMIFSKYKKVMVEETLVAQKGMLPPDETKKPWKNGLVTFVAFLVFGSAPLLAFMLLIPLTRDDSVRFAGACFFSLLSLAFLGLAKAKLASENYWLSALMTVSNGAIAAAVAYAVGWTLRNVAGLEDAAA